MTTMMQRIDEAQIILSTAEPLERMIAAVDIWDPKAQLCTPYNRYASPGSALRYKLVDALAQCYEHPYMGAYRMTHEQAWRIAWDISYDTSNWQETLYGMAEELDQLQVCLTPVVPELGKCLRWIIGLAAVISLV